MAIPGIRSVTDARQRLMADPGSQAAWAVLDCGFAVVADVFDECYAAAKRIIAGFLKRQDPAAAHASLRRACASRICPAFSPCHHPGFSIKESTLRGHPPP